MVDRFPEVQPKAWQRYLALKNEGDKKRPAIPAGDKTRTCEVQLKEIVRQELSDEYQTTLFDRIQGAAANVTNLKADLAAIVHVLMLEATQKGFTVDSEGDVRLNTAHSIVDLRITDILPDSMVRHKKYLSEGMRIPVSPLLDNVELTPKDSDFFKLFTHDHTQRIYSQYLSRGSTTANHPLWDELSIENIPFKTNNMSGMSQTCQAAAQQLANNIKVIWGDNIFDYSLRRLLLLYFQVNLAPGREEKYRNLLQRKSTEAEEKKKEEKVKLS